VALVGGLTAGAPPVLVGLVGGVVVQLVWNWTGRADKAADAMDRAMN